MIERLARALEHVEALPERAQEDLAEQIERYSQREALQSEGHRSFAGIWRDLPDDMEETLLRWRHESVPTPPLDEQLAWMDEQE